MPVTYEGEFDGTIADLVATYFNDDPDNDVWDMYMHQEPEMQPYIDSMYIGFLECHVDCDAASFSRPKCTQNGSFSSLVTLWHIVNMRGGVTRHITFLSSVQAHAMGAIQAWLLPSAVLHVPVPPCRFAVHHEYVMIRGDKKWPARTVFATPMLLTVKMNRCLLYAGASRIPVTQAHRVCRLSETYGVALTAR
jgi:hypothetical protein